MNNDELIKSLKQKRDEYLKLIDSINVTINALEPVATSVHEVKVKRADSGYDPTWSFQRKILVYIKVEARFVHTREIAQFIKTNEPDWDINELKGKISPNLSILKKKKVLININVGSSNINTFWGVAKWLDSEGRILPGHEYDESQLLSNIEKGEMIVF